MKACCDIPSCMNISYIHTTYVGLNRSFSTSRRSVEGEQAVMEETAFLNRPSTLIKRSTRAYIHGSIYTYVSFKNIL